MSERERWEEIKDEIDTANCRLPVSYLDVACQRIAALERELAERDRRIAELEADLLFACGVLAYASPPPRLNGLRGRIIAWIECWGDARVYVYRSAGLALTDEVIDADMRRAVDAAQERWESGGVTTKETQ